MLPPEISLNSELASSGNLNLLQHYSCCLLLHGLCDVRLCRMYTKWSQIHEITLPGALVCGCHSWHVPTTIGWPIATAIASNLIMNWDLFAFHFLPVTYLDHISPSVRALELWVCWEILWCHHIPLMTKNFEPVILSVSIHEDSREVIGIASFLVPGLHPTFLINVSSFYPPSFTDTWPMQLLQL